MTLGSTIFVGLLIAALGGQTSLNYVFWEADIAAAIIGLIIIALAFVAREQRKIGKVFILLVLGAGAGFWACSAGFQMQIDTAQVFWLNIVMCLACTFACLAQLQESLVEYDGDES